MDELMVEMRRIRRDITNVPGLRLLNAFPFQRLKDMGGREGEPDNAERKFDGKGNGQ